MQISNRVNNMSLSQTLAMTAKARELKGQGKDIISLSIGEPDFNTPDFIKNSAKTAIDENYNTYTPVNGYLELREAVCTKLKRDNNLNYNPNQIVVSTGAKHSIMNICLSVLNKGDEAIIPAPFWVSYPEMVKLAEGTPITIKCSIDSDFKLTPEQLEDAITEKTKLFIFSSPCNPSGSVYSKSELQALATIFAKYPQITIISDEIYEHINYAGKHESIAQFDEIYDQVVTVNGMSKAFAMTGWRVGYIASNEKLAKACNKLQGQFTSGTNCIAQRASITALETSPDKIKFMVNAFEKRRDLVLSLLRQIKGFKLNIPTGAFYVFPDISNFFGKTISGIKINNASDFSMYLLNNAGVATVTGEAFGSDNCIRISYAASEEILTEAISRIAKALA